MKKIGLVGLRKKLMAKNVSLGFLTNQNVSIGIKKQYIFTTLSVNSVKVCFSEHQTKTSAIQK